MSEFVTIKNHRPTVLGFQAGLRLGPGEVKKDVPMDVYLANKSDKTFQSKLKLGWVSVRLPDTMAAEARLETPAEPEGADALEGLNAAQAVSLAKTADNVELLDAWYGKEAAREKPRKTVLDAIKARLGELTKSPEETEEGDENVVDLEDGDTDPDPDPETAVVE